MLSMIDELSHENNPIPAPLIEPDVACVVYCNDKWRRGRIVKVHKNDLESSADVHLVDTGHDRRFPFHALKPIKEQYVRPYPPAVYHVKLGGHDFFDSDQWSQAQVDLFRSMVWEKTIIVKFLTSDPKAEVSEIILIDFI